jgi:hypothetical protein
LPSWPTGEPQKYVSDAARGDRLQFADPATMQIVAEGVVAEVDAINGTALLARLEGHDTALLPGTVADNLS